MKRSKKLYILLGVLVAACIATLAVTRIEERKEQIENSGETILELSGDSVQSLFWEYNDEALSFLKGKAWLYEKDEKFPVSEDKLNDLLEQFQPLNAAFVIENVGGLWTIWSGQSGVYHQPLCGGAVLRDRIGRFQ